MSNATTKPLLLGILLFSITSASLLSTAQQEKQYLDAGRGQTPFDVTRHSVPIVEIVPAGPPKDGIPALDRPKFVPASGADKFLSKHDKILGIEYNGVAKAYPVKILNWHEIVNDDFNGKPAAVTW
jgi:hypothetical protein